MNGFPIIEGADAWLERGREAGAAFQLMVSLPVEGNKRRLDGFWLEFSPPGGGELGWLRFSLVVVMKWQAIFAATEWRPAGDPAPLLQDVLLGAAKAAESVSGYRPEKHEELIAWADRTHRLARVGEQLQRQANPPQAGC